MSKSSAKSRKAPAARRAAPKPARSDRHIRELMHELQVYTEEVTVQNEQLVRAQHELEITRDRFADLYDFAPIGYLLLDPHGTVLDINLAGAALFGKSRVFLINLPLPSLIAKEDREKLRQFLPSIRPEHVGAPPQIEVQLKGDAHHVVRMIARPRSDRGVTQVFAAMFDITEARRLERERLDALSREQARSLELGKEVAERTAAQRQVKTLLSRLVSVQEEERRRLARNLHDHLGQQLSALRLGLTSLRGDGSSPEQTAKRLAGVERLVGDLDRDVTYLAWDLRPVALDELGLQAALASLAHGWSEHTGITTEFLGAIDPNLRLPGGVESNIYRLVQEALNNVAKHAQATCVSILVRIADDELIIIIEDDGRGFAVDEPKSPGHLSGGMGLVNMRERAALFDGRVVVESTPGKGTTVFVTVPAKALTADP
ncbi:MAG TPA: ATP-binding protein [Vicinamibacterales bacterium]